MPSLFFTPRIHPPHHPSYQTLFVSNWLPQIIVVSIHIAISCEYRQFLQSLSAIFAKSVDNFCKVTLRLVVAGWRLRACWRERNTKLYLNQ